MRAKTKTLSVRKGGKKLFGAAALAVLKARAQKAKPEANKKRKKNPSRTPSGGITATLKKLLAGATLKRKNPPRRRNNAAPPASIAELHETFQGRPIDNFTLMEVPSWVPDDVVLLGQASAIGYITAKDHIEGGKTRDYRHEFGEEGGQKPLLVADKFGNMILIGGDYKITPAGIKD